MSAATRATSSRTATPTTASFADLVDDLERALRLRLRESPLLTLAAAGGLGYVLGGGLTVGVLSRAVQLGIRFALTSRAEQMLAEWVTMGRRENGSREASN
jgi:hypothetical protein